MADKQLVNLVTTAELASLVSSNGLIEGLQYKNTETGQVFLATSVLTYRSLAPYKIYTALLSQTSVFTTSGVLEIGKEYQINQVKPGDDFANVGYVDSSHFIATGTTPTTWSNGTKVFNITDSPIVADVFENTLGGEVEWVNEDPGNYLGKLAGAFTVGKTVCVPFGFNGAMFPFYPMGTYYQVATNLNWMADAISLYVFTDTESVNIDTAIGTGKIWVEIRVYY